MKKIYIWGLISVFCLGCNEFDEDINKTSNDPSVASATQLIANSSLYLAGLSSSPQGEFYAQYLAETQYVGLSLYTQSNFNFYYLYEGPLMNLQKVIDNSEGIDGNDGPVVNQLAVANILKTYFIWNITDRWGDVPYSEALKGNENFKPTYDTQESIYSDLFIQLKSASDAIVPGDIVNDIIYDGDITKWKKLANSLRMLMALRLSEVDAQQGKTEFNAALAAGIMESNDDNLLFQHLAEEAQENYWYDQIENQNRDWWSPTVNLVEHMLPVEDPRLSVYANTNSEGEYVGLEYGTETGWEGLDPSLLGSQIYEQDAPVYLVTYPELLFAKAEAAKLGWIPGGDAEAQSNYEMAIKESLKMWTGSDEGFDDMNSHTEIAYDPAMAIEQIATQRWVHLFMNGYEAWAEYRRTGYPELISVSGKEVPTRQGYPDDEKFLNEANYKAAVERQFGDEEDLYGKVWWDK